MKVADYIINFLADKGVDKIFVVYGAANGDLIDAFTRTDKTEYVCVMHEQAGGFAAEGYAKISGRPGVVIATSGPGGQNLVTPIANCYFDSVPCIFITGQVPTYVMRKDLDVRQVGFQETDIVSIVSPITKWAGTIHEPYKGIMDHAWNIATKGRPGPVLLDVPLDVQKSDILDSGGGLIVPVVEYSYTVQHVYDFIEDLSWAKKPVMLIGNGVRGAVKEFREVADRLKMPCFPTWNALDIVTSDFPWYGGRVGTYGGAGRNFGIQNCDLLLSVGSRLSGRVTGGSETQMELFAPKAVKYVVDIDPAYSQQKTQRIKIEHDIHCDAKLFFQILLESIRHVYSFRDWTETVMDWKKKYDPVKEEFYMQDAVHPYAFMRNLSRIMGKDDVLVGDCGGNLVVLSHAFETKYGQRILTNNGNSPMGFSFAAAMGCWFADPKRQVVCTIGDGGFNMNIQELQTLLNYGIKTKTFIMNNHVYGITKQFQETNFEGRMEACGPTGYKPPDFRKIVEAYGVRLFTIDNTSEMRSKIKDVLEYDGPVVCDVDMHDFHTYEPRISNWEDPIHDMYPHIELESV